VFTISEESQSWFSSTRATSKLFPTVIRASNAPISTASSPRGRDGSSNEHLPGLAGVAIPYTWLSSLLSPTWPRFALCSIA
jgi:hypothetical protein